MRYAMQGAQNRVFAGIALRVGAAKRRFPRGTGMKCPNWREIMTTVTIDLPETVFSALRLAPNEFVKEMRIAAAVQWYAQEKVSQGKAAEIAGLNRVEFLDELYRRKVPAVQVTPEELKKEIDGA